MELDTRWATLPFLIPSFRHHRPDPRCGTCFQIVMSISRNETIVVSFALTDVIIIARCPSHSLTDEKQQQVNCQHGSVTKKFLIISVIPWPGVWKVVDHCGPVLECPCGELILAESQLERWVNSIPKLHGTWELGWYRNSISRRDNFVIPVQEGLGIVIDISTTAYCGEG